jgi:hypothetical protein
VWSISTKERGGKLNKTPSLEEPSPTVPLKMEATYKRKTFCIRSPPHLKNFFLLRVKCPPHTLQFFYRFFMFCPKCWTVELFLTFWIRALVWPSNPSFIPNLIVWIKWLELWIVLWN